MSSFPSLAPLASVLPDTRPQAHHAVTSVPAIMPAAASRRVADGLPEDVKLGAGAAAQSSEPIQATKPTDREQAALDEINQALALASIGLQFEFEKDADQMIARVVDISSGELIRQMPSQEMLQVAKMLDKLQGLIFHRAA